MEIGSLLLNQRFATPIVPYTEADLRDDLAQGVGNVLAGIGSDYRLDVSADNGTVLIKHKDVDTGAGAGATHADALGADDWSGFGQLLTASDLRDEEVTVTVTDQAAWTETVHHEAVYGWVNK